MAEQEGCLGMLTKGVSLNCAKKDMLKKLGEEASIQQRIIDREMSSNKLKPLGSIRLEHEVQAVTEQLGGQYGRSENHVP